ncbi:MAG: hypothetical protein AB7O49_14755 [Sphingomonadales bacterium]
MPPHRAWILACGLAAVAVPFAAAYSSILNHFYRDGAYLLDSGLLAYLMTHADLRQSMPPVLGGASFYGLHVSPVFSLLGAIAQALDAAPAAFFALFTGACHALLAAGVFWALTGPVGLRGWRAAPAALLAIGFSMSGLAIAVLRYPHFEMLIAAMAILFLVALHERRHGLAAVFLAVALNTREDAGFHVAALLAVLVVARRMLRMERAGERVALCFLAVAFLYSAGVILVQALVSVGESSFARIYSGMPPYQHLHPGLVAERLLGWLMLRGYAILPILVALGWAILRRRPLVLVGYASTLPWLALHLTALAVLPGTLSSYYAFPLVIASFWPLLGALPEGRRAGPAEQREIAAGFLLMIAATFTAFPAQHNPNGTSVAAMFAPPPSREVRNGIDHAIETVARSRAALGTVLIDDGVAALAPDAFRPGNLLWNNPDGQADTVVYFRGAYLADEARSRAERLGLAREYRLAGTPVHIATSRDLERVPDLKDLVEPVSGRR